MSMFRVVSGVSLFLKAENYTERAEAHYTENYTEAHYTEWAGLLYHNLSNCFDSTLYWKQRSFVPQLIQKRILRTRATA